MIASNNIHKALDTLREKRSRTTNGQITIRKVKNVQYKFIRIGLSNWIPLHRHRWEAMYGPVPEGKVITFKNGITLDCSLDNLICMSHSDFVRNVKKGKKGGQKALQDFNYKQRIRLQTITAELQAKSRKLTSIDAELEEFKRTDFPGRVETNDTKIKKMKRLDLLRDIEALQNEKLSLTKTHKTNVHNS